MSLKDSYSLRPYWKWLRSKKSPFFVHGQGEQQYLLCVHMLPLCAQCGKWFFHRALGNSISCLFFTYPFFAHYVLLMCWRWWVQLFSVGSSTGQKWRTLPIGQCPSPFALNEVRGKNCNNSLALSFLLVSEKKVSLKLKNHETKKIALALAEQHVGPSWTTLYTCAQYMVWCFYSSVQLPGASLASVEVLLTCC